MTDRPASPEEHPAAASPGRHALVCPRSFSTEAGADAYMADPVVRRLAGFFEDKTLATLKHEDRCERWYEDWLAYQAEHGLYASVLSPRQYSSRGRHFDLLRYARFLEVFAYFSPAHGYSAQVTFLGLFAILMGTNDALKKEAVATLEDGGLLAFAVSERAHGSDLLANEFVIRETKSGRFVAGGTKFYIGNSSAATIISVLAKRTGAGARGRPSKREPFALLALRPARATGFRNVRKIGTLGVRAAHVGEFEVDDHELPASDLIAEGRRAWDAIMGTVTLGKFFLGFGSIGICEHAFVEAADHLEARMLYGRPAMAMPHIRATMVEAYARLTAMKLYAFRALDYVHAARAEDRRYLLFCAVQKARVSTEGVRVMALLSECVGAWGFETETYFEMALRDIQLVPGLEGSAHINLGLSARFCPRYFGGDDHDPAQPQSLAAGEVAACENPYLMTASAGRIGSIRFPSCLDAYRAIDSVENVGLFVRQVERVRSVLIDSPADAGDMRRAMHVGACLAVVAFAQLVAENAKRTDVAPPMISVIFHQLIGDLGAAALALASDGRLDRTHRARLRRVVTLPRTSEADWDFVSVRMADR